jgi:thiol:disulfide interchange protein
MNWPRFLSLFLMISTSMAFVVRPPYADSCFLDHPTINAGTTKTKTTTTFVRSATVPIEKVKEEISKRRFVPRILRRYTDLRRSSPLVQVQTLQEYKQQVIQENDSLVVVFFTAPWCRTCQRLQPRIRAFTTATTTKGVKFVQMPMLTETTAHLCQGLGVSKFPMVHIYHPQAGLVEERTINRRSFGDFQTVLQTYRQGLCAVEYNEDSTGNHQHPKL